MRRAFSCFCHESFLKFQLTTKSWTQKTQIILDSSKGFPGNIFCLHLCLWMTPCRPGFNVSLTELFCFCFYGYIMACLHNPHTKEKIFSPSNVLEPCLLQGEIFQRSTWALMAFSEEAFYSCDPLSCYNLGCESWRGALRGDSAGWDQRAWMLHNHNLSEQTHGRTKTALHLPTFKDNDTSCCWLLCWFSSLGSRVLPLFPKEFIPPLAARQGVHWDSRGAVFMRQLWLKRLQTAVRSSSRSASASGQRVRRWLTSTQDNCVSR